MRICAICCEILAREAARAAAYSPNIVHLVFLPSGLHSTPDELRTRIQAEIDAASDGRFDYIILGYGLCSRGTADLVARDTPIVIPRAHDCITLFLGSRERYDREFNERPGTYYYSAGWIERMDGDLSQGTLKPLKETQAEERYLEYVEKFGEDNAKYLIEQEGLWLANYSRAALIDTGIGDIETYRRFTQGVAESNAWEYEELQGDTRLIDILFGGNWDEDEFLIVRPGQKTIEQVMGGIISAE